MVAHPGRDVLIPALTSVYVVVAVPVPALGRALCVKRVSGWHRPWATPDGSLCQIRVKVWSRELPLRSSRPARIGQRGQNRGWVSLSDVHDPEPERHAALGQP